MPTPVMPYEHLGEALATDYLYVREQFSDEQWDLFRRTRQFVDEEVLPVISGYWERAELPWPLIRRLAELRVVGDDIERYGCPGLSPLACGLLHMELHRGDGRLRVGYQCTAYDRARRWRGDGSADLRALLRKSPLDARHVHRASADRRRALRVRCNGKLARR